MPEVEVSVACPAYGSELVTLDAASHAVTFTLEEGTHTVSSEPFVLGRLPGYEGRRLLGVLTFTYTYVCEPDIVTVCGPTFESVDAMHLTTCPEGTDETCVQRAAGGLAEDDRGGNRRWGYRTPLTPGLEPVFRGLAAEGARALVAALQATPGLRVHVRTPVPELGVEDHRNLLTVYRDGELQGLYDPEATYDEATSVVTIESIWGGTVQLTYQEDFANVIGSTPDPHIAGLSWLRLWENQFGAATICTSYQWAGRYAGVYPCGPALVGGHIIAGQWAATVPAGANYVYIIPICHAHNNNDNVYMEALQYGQGIWLKNYLH